MHNTQNATVQQLEERYQVNTYAKLPIVVDRGEGCFVFDQHGKRYLDLYAGHAVTATGHCHPTVVSAIQQQASQLIFYSNATYSSTRARALEKLIELSRPYHQVFLVNSGAEANENAIKLARALTGRQEVISTLNAFHGRTYGSLSATGIEKYRNFLNTPVPGHRILPFEQVAGSVSEQTAAVLIEPIQSMGGVVTVPIPTIREIARSCKANGSLLIFDEIQTGVGRTGGNFLYSQKLDLVPDLTCLAKGIASGYPAGAVLMTEEIAGRVSPGDLGSTFGGSPLACAAMLATLQVIEEEELLGRVDDVSGYLRNALTELPVIEELRGDGLLVGIRFKGLTAKAAQKSLLEASILTGTSYDPSVLRLMPALTLGRDEADIFIEAVKSL
jgi:acetylornithine/succinyldiaminopimelate/putrescine aminotransferase